MTLAPMWTTSPVTQTDNVQVSATPNQAMPAGGVGVFSDVLTPIARPLGELAGGVLRVGATTTNTTADVIGSAAGPAIVLLIGGVALAMYARRKR